MTRITIADLLASRIARIANGPAAVPTLDDYARAGRVMRDLGYRLAPR